MARSEEGAEEEKQGEEEKEEEEGGTKRYDVVVVGKGWPSNQALVALESDMLLRVG